MIPPPSKRYCIYWSPDLVEVGTESEGPGGVRSKVVLGFGRTEAEVLTNLMRGRTSDEDLARFERVGKTKFAEETIASLGLPDDEIKKMAQELIPEIKRETEMLRKKQEQQKLKSFDILKALHPEMTPASILAGLARVAYNIAQGLNVELVDDATKEKFLREIAANHGLDADETNDAIRAVFSNPPLKP